jgi:L-fuculose-phosphate aldolase
LNASLTNLEKQRPASSPWQSSDATPASIYNSAAANDAKEEIIRVGQKLWQRHYVDGAGGNISVRLGDYVLCTPTMLSKGDLKPEDICMTDLTGQRVAGTRARTSELLLHLSIYRNSDARSVVHCHPPHATAFAVLGVAPPIGFLVEQEIFVGSVPVAPYETPGTEAFSKTILPFIENNNTVLLANHGVVSWSDNAMHAEWLIEIIDTYCQTMILVHQMGGAGQPIPSEKIAEILRIKSRLGYPDARLANKCSGEQ